MGLGFVIIGFHSHPRRAMADEVEELSAPASINSSEGVGLASEDQEEQVSLPPSVNSNNEEPAARKACCKKNCARHFAEEQLEAWRLELHQGSHSEMQKKKFQLARGVFEANSKQRRDSGLQWIWKDQKVCRKFWEQQVQVSPNQVDKWLKLCRSGAVELPAAGPALAKPTPQLERVNVWFLEVYQLLADPLAIPGSEDHAYFYVAGDGSTGSPGRVVHESVEDVTHPLYTLSLNLDATKGRGSGPVLAARRHVNFTTLLDFYRFYQADVGEAEQVSRSTFERGYNGYWSKHLILKSPVTGNKCSTCLSLDEKRSNATSDAERFSIDQEKQAHLDCVRQDRSVNTRGNIKCADLKNFQPHRRDVGCMKIMLDGMDQQKFSIPRARRLCGTSEYGKAWKTNVHLVGAVVWGVEEQYYIMPMDVPKDSSMQCTILAKALEETRKRLKMMDEALDLPAHLIVAIDNTPREGKNQYFAQFCAFLASYLFETVEVQYMQVSHTHNELDQRFSSMASLIKRCDCLQSLEDLKTYLEQHMRPAQGRALSVHLLGNTWSFKTWFDTTGCRISGLTATRLEPNANHLWRFSRRERLEGGFIENHHDEWVSTPEHSADVCLSVKQFISSSEVSQNPEVVMPHHVHLTLSRESLSPSSLNPFTANTLVEFRKTAELVSKQPWNLLVAQAYLLGMCDRNEARAVPEPPQLSWIFSTTTPRMELAAGRTLDEAEPHNHPQPRPVQVKAKARPGPKGRAVLKRPAAAVDSAGAPARPPPASPASSRGLAAEARPEPLAASLSGAKKRPAASGTHGGCMKRPAAAALGGPPVQHEKEAAVAAITSLPDFECFGCSKCRKKSTPKIGCQECRAKAASKHDGYHKSAEGWIYRLKPPHDVD